MFGRRRRREAVVGAIEAALAADAQARQSLVDALGRIDARLAHGLEEQALTQEATGVTVQHLRSTVAGTKDDLAHAVEYLAQMCSLLSDRIESERVERRMLISAMTELARPAAVERARSAERVIGGSFPAQETLDLGAEASGERRSRWA